MANKKQAEKRLDKDSLKVVQTITITLTATEGNLQRIGAMLLLADHDFKVDDTVIDYDKMPLPWEDPSDPKFIASEAEMVDYNAVRNAIMALLPACVAKIGVDDTKKLMATFGGPPLQSVLNEQLVEFHRQLERTLADK